MIENKKYFLALFLIAMIFISCDSVIQGEIPLSDENINEKQLINEPDDDEIINEIEVLDNLGSSSINEENYLPVIYLHDDDDCDIERICYKKYDGESGWDYRIQLTVVWDDEDHPIPGVDEVYDAWREINYGNKKDLETVELYILNGYIRVIYFKGTWSGSQSWNVLEPDHKNKIYYCSYGPNSNGAFTLYINTWNHLMSLANTNSIYDYDPFYPNENDYEDALRDKSRDKAEYDYRPHWDWYKHYIQKVEYDRYDHPSDPDIPCSSDSFTIWPKDDDLDSKNDAKRFIICDKELNYLLGNLFYDNLEDSYSWNLGWSPEYIIWLTSSVNNNDFDDWALKKFSWRIGCNPKIECNQRVEFGEPWQSDDTWAAVYRLQGSNIGYDSSLTTNFINDVIGNPSKSDVTPLPSNYGDIVQYFFVDDDSTPPTINWEYSGDNTDGNPGALVVSASDASGLIENPSGFYIIPSTLGTHTFTFRATDADNDRPGDSLSTTITVRITIVDDDSIAPDINIDYKDGDGTDGRPGKFVVTASDASGLSVDPSGTYYVPNSLGTYSFTFTAIDNDNDRSGDSLTTIVSRTITIKDDDTTPPEIQLGYEGGDGTDANPGYFAWVITDEDDGIGDGDSGLSEVNVWIEFISSEDLPSEIFALTQSEVKSGSWELPFNLGTYTITVFARDNDDDRTIIVDSLTTEIVDLQEIIDDDITPPELFDLSIEDDFLNVDISFIAIDSSSGDDQGIGEINIFVDNELIIDYVPLPTETFFEFEIPNYWITELGTHDISIEIIDADDDRSNDALSAIFNGEFEVVFEEVRQFVVWEILQLNDKIFEIEQSNDWRHPEDNLKASTKEKLNLLIQMVSTDEFCDAYDKLLHDIKPKLTGLKTNELEESWGNRVFVNPWVVDEDLNEEFRVDCNLILTHIQILINNS